MFQPDIQIANLPHLNYVCFSAVGLCKSELPEVVDSLTEGVKTAIHRWSFALAQNQVDVWRINLMVTERVIKQILGTLSAEEIERADQFHFEKDRHRFIARRARMREILGGYLGVAPQRLVFSCGSNGKPELAGRFESSGIRFNLSCSKGYALLAVTKGLRVGIDIEVIDAKYPVTEISQEFFSANEIQRLHGLPIDEQVDAFFVCWTRKEAYIKARGDGLSIPLQLCVALRRGTLAGLLAATIDPSEMQHWTLCDLEVLPGYKAALAVEGGKFQLCYYQMGSEGLLQLKRSDTCFRVSGCFATEKPHRPATKQENIGS